MKAFPFPSRVPSLKRLAFLACTMLSVCGCGLSEKDDRSIRFAVLKYEQIRVTVKSTAGKLMVEISAPGFDVIACGFGTGPNGSDAIDQVVGIPNGGNKTFVFGGVQNSVNLLEARRAG